MLEGNPTLLKELVRNLVDNAINYTPSAPGRPGVITARVLADPFGRVVVLQVEDNGPGIPEAERELVFQPFYRVLGNEADGSGLGLPIVREIARQHHATVQLEDAHPGQHPPGTRFSLRFDANGQRRTPRAWPTAAALSSLRICSSCGRICCVQPLAARVSLRRAGTVPNIASPPRVQAK